MNRIFFTIDAVPVPKGRPRFTRGGHAYTPAKTKEYERLVGKVAKIAIMNESVNLEAPLIVNICFYMPIPKSWSKKKVALALEGKIVHTKKPDKDNLEKSLNDGCNGILWKDDSQIFGGWTKKEYSDKPRTEVEVIYTDLEHG